MEPSKQTPAEEIKTPAPTPAEGAKPTGDEEVKMVPGPGASGDDLLINSRKKLGEMYQMQQLQKRLGDLVKPREFWDSQPVPKLRGETVTVEKGTPIEIKKVEDVRKSPYTLPDGFEWVEVDLTKDDEIKNVYTLLTENYVEDEDNMFRFDYSIDFLRWALTPPNYYKDWIIAVQVIKNKKLVGFISGVPVHVVVQGEKIKMAEINFLCVHKKLRTNRLAPVLIKEVTRRINLRNIWQAIYTAGVIVPTPISETRYYHRSLNPKKLIDVNFSSLGPNQTLSRVTKLYKLPEEPTIKSIRQMKTKDISAVTDLLNEFLSQFDVHFKFTTEEVKHWFLPRPGVVSCYVVENNKVVTDFLSFYSLPSSILKHEKHKLLKAAYSFYNVAKTVTLTELMNNALILAQKEEFDVFNALDIMTNMEFFKELKFNSGDGLLHYYLYNWRLPKNLTPGQIGTVLL